MKSDIKFAFFGGEPLAVPILNRLKTAGLFPKLIICNPDRPKGRGHAVTPPPVKLWAQAENIEVFQPTNYKDKETKEKLSASEWDLFVVVAYNFILPDWLLTIPKNQVINVHPSLLPKLRGASPIRSAILTNQPENVGVTIMLMDQEMDHGPILNQRKLFINPKNWPLAGNVLDATLANLGGELLTETIPAWINNEITPQTQNHEQATYCGRFQKGSNQITINPFDLPTKTDAFKIWCTINAFTGIGDTFFIYNNKRVKIKQAKLNNLGNLEILRVIPEGKKEIDFNDYLQQIKR